MKRGDRTFDVGRVAGELQHAFMRASGDRHRAEPFIGHFLWEYSSHFPDRQAMFESVTARAPYYMGAEPAAGRQERLHGLDAYGRTAGQAGQAAAAERRARDTQDPGWADEGGRDRPRCISIDTIRRSRSTRTPPLSRISVTEDDHVEEIGAVGAHPHVGRALNVPGPGGELWFGIMASVSTQARRSIRAHAVRHLAPDHSTEAIHQLRERQARAIRDLAGYVRAACSPATRRTTAARRESCSPPSPRSAAHRGRARRLC